MFFEEKTISTERIYEGAILNLRRDKVTIHTGGTSFREIVEHNGGAVAVPITSDGKIVMVRQYRKALEQAVLELPAGKIEKGEEPLQTIVRELQEETGYSAGNMEFLTAFYPSVGYTNEVLYIYLATDLTPGMTNYDENEAMDILEVDFEEAHNMVVAGEIQDAKTMLGILLAKNHFETM
jgi:ADP-ribose pyrophosphatase